MHVAVLGGTSFVGRYIVEALLDAGHDVTIANRGQTNPGLFPGVPRITGDRRSMLPALAALEPEVVVDVSGYAPDDVAAAARAVAGSVRCYVFISSVSVYDFSRERDESSETLALPPGAPTDVPAMEFYGPQKARAERDAIGILGESHVLVLRPGLIVGPHDATDRFTYWPVRVARGGRILAPRAPSYPVQVVDVRDLAAFAARTIDAELRGTYNVAGTPGAVTLRAVLDAAIAETGPAPEIVWVSEDFLVEQEVAPWSELPLWLPPQPEFRAFCSVSNARARSVGLTLRPIRETVRDVLREYRERADPTLTTGLSAERERALLAAWSGRGRAG